MTTTLSANASAVYAAMLAHAEGCAETRADGTWRTIYLDNAIPAGMSRRSFAGYLSALKGAGLYLSQGDDCFGLVRLPSEPAPTPEADQAIAAIETGLAEGGAVPSLVAAFRAIMSDPMGGTPTVEQMRAVIAAKGEATEACAHRTWGVWYVEPQGTLSLCEYDGCVGYEAYPTREAAEVAAATYTARYASTYVAALVPPGLVVWDSGAECEAYTTGSAGPGTFEPYMECGTIGVRMAMPEAIEAPSAHYRMRKVELGTGRILTGEGPVYSLAGMGRNANDVLCVYGDAPGSMSSANVDYVEFCGSNGEALAPAMVPMPVQQQQACAAAPVAPAITSRSAMGRKLRRIVRTIAARTCGKPDPLAVRVEAAAYIAANAVAGRIVVRHGGTDCGGYSGESASILPACVSAFEAFRQHCGDEAEGPWFCYVVEGPDREAFESAYDARLCGLSRAELEHFSGR